MRKEEKWDRKKKKKKLRKAPRRALFSFSANMKESSLGTSTDGERERISTKREREGGQEKALENERRKEEKKERVEKKEREETLNPPTTPRTACIKLSPSAKEFKTFPPTVVGNAA